MIIPSSNSGLDHFLLVSTTVPDSGLVLFSFPPWCWIYFMIFHVFSPFSLGCYFQPSWTDQLQVGRTLVRGVREKNHSSSSYIEKRLEPLCRILKDQQKVTGNWWKSNEHDFWCVNRKWGWHYHNPLNRASISRELVNAEGSNMLLALQKTQTAKAECRTHLLINASRKTIWNQQAILANYSPPQKKTNKSKAKKNSVSSTTRVPFRSLGERNCRISSAEVGLSCAHWVLCWEPSELMGASLEQLSNEKRPGWLGYLGDYTTKLYRDYNEPS